MHGMDGSSPLSISSHLHVDSGSSAVHKQHRQGLAGCSVASSESRYGNVFTLDKSAEGFVFAHLATLEAHRQLAQQVVHIHTHRLEGVHLQQARVSSARVQISTRS